MTISEMIEDIKNSISIKYNIQNDAQKIAILVSVIENAVDDVKLARNYPTSYSDIESDLVSYKSKIQRIAEYDFLQTGATGQTNHSENGVSRTWIDRVKLFAGIVSLCR